MISKHGSPSILGQYFLTIYNEYPLNADLRSYRKAFKFGERVIKDKRTRKFAKGVNRAANGIDAGQQVVSAFQSRGLEDNEDLELFGREYDLVDERDIIDDLD